MRRTRVIFAALVAALALCAPALADKTFTLLTAGSAVTSMTFDLQTPGQIFATVCGRAPIQGGGFGDITCYSITLNAGAVFTAVNNLATGQALTFWQSKAL